MLGEGAEKGLSVELQWASRLFIDGEFEDGRGSAIEIPSPSTGSLLATVAVASPEQCERAVVSAERAFAADGWRDDAPARAAALMRLADVMEANSERLVAAIVHEVGTPVTTARAMQVETPIALLRWFAEAAALDRTEDLGSSLEPVPSHSVVAYRPTGVVAAITAYNYPLLLGVAKFGAALAAGCTAVVMPSPLTPLSTLLLAELVGESGLPPGVLNFIVGGADIGAQLTSHPLVDKVTFTGSVEVGRQVMAQAAQSVSDVVLELGGKSPAIILPSARLETVTEALHGRYLRNAGQGCASPTRILVPRSRLDDFVDLSRAAYATMLPDDPFKPSTHVGPVIREMHRDRIEGYVDMALRQGAKILAGGGPVDFPCGWWVNPTLIGEVDNDARISREEIFGPVAVVLPYDGVEQAVALANDSDFGLHAYLYGELDECRGLTPALRAGSVTINGGGGFRPDAPMGGFKKSGVGREFGELGIREFLEPQHVQWKLDWILERG